MAYINVAEWTPDQVTDWLKGLDDSMYNYTYSFTNNEVGGRELLNIRPYELEQLGMKSIGHQEIVLEAVENLRNFHYHLKNDNLQFMALHVATAARNLHRQLAANHMDVAKVETRTLHDISRTIATIKPLIGWLERAPFRKQDQYREICRNMLRLGLELATIAQRDRFVERPVEQITATALKLERLANYIIQDISDPMLLQPATLNLVTLKKRESELGFNIEFSYNGTHRVTDIKYNSPAHNSGKIEDGDEIVQINYQTVVGWQHKTVLAQLRESLPDVVLTVKKRPKHTKMFGQIYMQPYRLPSKKRSMAGRWGVILPSPRPGFSTLGGHDGEAFKLPINNKTDEKVAAAASSDTDSSCSDILTPTDTKSTSKEIRLYYPKPRAMLQRRNTICGDEFLSLKHADLVIPSWHERKGGGVACDPSSPSLRDKSVSFGFGLEIAARPTTCIGIAGGAGKYSAGNDTKGFRNDSKKMQQLSEISGESQHELTGLPDEDIYKAGVSKVVRFDSNMKLEDYSSKDEKYRCNVENTILETFEPIPFADEGDEDALETLRNCKTEKAQELLDAIEKVTRGCETQLVEAVNAPLLQNRRGRLDKSHSTPAYDNSGEESDTPPAIEPRKEFLLVTPPIPPPRPRKQKELAPPVVPPPPPKPASMQPSPLHKTSESEAGEISELHTPTKSRTLTLKKKYSLMAKRRNINLKMLGTGDIQGHLYRRKKDHRGVTYWARVYFVMLDTILYGFRTKQSNNASCVIFLPGFTVSLAKEVHSKPHAFKVYHTAKTFYFAAESLDALNQWVEFLRQASLQTPSTAVGNSESKGMEVNTKDLFSENDSSGEESDALVNKNLSTPSPQGAKDITAAMASTENSAVTPTSSTNAKQERSCLGPWRKLNIGPFKRSSSKVSSDIPVPTEQYRTFRKVPGGSFGLQIGANRPGYHDPVTPPSPAPVIPPIAEKPNSSLQRKLSRSSSRSSVVSNTESSASLGLGPPSSPAPTLSSIQQQRSLESPIKSLKKGPCNFLHASNPNLVEFDFQTAKTLDYLPKMTVSNALDNAHHHNTQGFVTLKDLMLRKQEEEAKEMYNNRVLLGVERKQGQHSRTESTASKQQDVSITSTQQHAAGGEKLSKTQSRSLPKTPDYEISFKPDDEQIKRTRTKEGLKLRDFGYELISGDEPISNSSSPSMRAISEYRSEHSASVSFVTSSSSSSQHSGKPRQFQSFLHKGSKKHSTGSITMNMLPADVAAGDKRLASLKKKNKKSSEGLFPFYRHLTSGNSGSTSSGMTMTLPLNKKSKSNHALESVTCIGGGGGGLGSNGGGSIKKSQTYNQDLKDKAGAKYDAHRKNSAPITLLHKFSGLSMPSSNSPHAGHHLSGTKLTKEKRLLGSPLLHRTIFGLSNTPPAVDTEADYDDEIFSQVIIPSHKQPTHSVYRSGSSVTSSSSNICTAEMLAPPLPPAPPPPTATPPTAAPAAVTSPHEPVTPKISNASSVDSKAATPEYPNMECPPVFEPEIYSLTEPNTSLTLLLRRNNSNNATNAVTTPEDKQ